MTEANGWTDPSTSSTLSQVTTVPKNYLTFFVSFFFFLLSNEIVSLVISLLPSSSPSWEPYSSSPSPSSDQSLPCLSFSLVSLAHKKKWRMEKHCLEIKNFLSGFIFRCFLSCYTPLPPGCNFYFARFPALFGSWLSSSDCVDSLLSGWRVRILAKGRCLYILPLGLPWGNLYTIEVWEWQS